MFAGLLLSVTRQSRPGIDTRRAEPTTAVEHPEGFVLLVCIMRGNVFSGFVLREVNLA